MAYLIEVATLVVAVASLISNSSINFHSRYEIIFIIKKK